MPKAIDCKYGCGKPYIPTRPGRVGHAHCYRAWLSAQAESLRELVAPGGGFAESVVAPPKFEHPKGWEPHVEESGNTAKAVSQPTTEANPDERKLIEGWNLNPDEWRIVGPVNCRRWQANTPVKDAKGKTVGYEQVWLYYYRANLERVDPIRESQTAALIEEIRTHVPVPISPPEGDEAFVVAIADVQMGKSDVDGSAGTAGRFLRSIDAVEERIAWLRTGGKANGVLYVLGMGDLIENCADFYAQQTFRADLNRREQINVTRRLIVKALERWAPLFSRVVVACVGGNHGENRRKGKSFTDFSDNDDVAIFEQVQEILAANPSTYGHVSFVIPKDELGITLEIAGEVVGITHGHLYRKGKACEWWAKHAHGQQPIGSARILIGAHYHHLFLDGEGSKSFIQCPALEGGSDWYRNQSGQAARRGVLTLRVGTNVGESGWADLEVV